MIASRRSCAARGHACRIPRARITVRCAMCGRYAVAPATDGPGRCRIARRGVDRLRFGGFHRRQDAAGHDGQCDRFDHRPRCTEPDVRARRPAQQRCAARSVRGQSRLAHHREGGLRAAPRSAQSAALEPGTAGRQLQRVRPAVGGDHQGQHQRRQRHHPGGDVPSRPVHTRKACRTRTGSTGSTRSQCTGDTVALTYPGGISGLDSVVKFRWNGNGVELIGNTGR